MKLLLVVNPKAGGTDHGDTLQKIKGLIEAHDIESQTLVTTGQADEKEIRKAIEKFNPDQVIVGGGDGTLQMVSKVLLPYGLPMGILPLGSANGFATALDIPTDPVEAARKCIASQAIRQVDMLRFGDGNLCVHLSDVGVNALIVKKYEEAGERGMLGYAKHLLSAIQETPLYNITVRTPEKTYEKEGFMMVFANAHKYGTGVQISDGSVSDGKFEICNVEQVTLDEAIKAGLTIINIFVDNEMFSDVIVCREAEITLDKKAHFQVDGEYMGQLDHLHIEIVPGALKLLI